MRPRHTIKNCVQDTLGNYFCQENKNLSPKKKELRILIQTSHLLPFAKQKNSSATSKRVATFNPKLPTSPLPSKKTAPLKTRSRLKSNHRIEKLKSVFQIFQTIFRIFKSLFLFCLLSFTLCFSLSSGSLTFSFSLSSSFFLRINFSLNFSLLRI